MSQPLKDRLDRQFGHAGPLVVCVIAYALAFAAALWACMYVGSQSPLLAAFAATVAGTLVTFVISAILGNASVYDPYWSVAPPVFLAYWMAVAMPPDAPMALNILVFLAVCLWAIRLTFNCMRRWTSLGHEDFRYQDLRAQFPGLFPLVNLFGIQMFPTVLVYLGCLPLFAIVQSGTGLTWLAVPGLIVTFAAIALETVADEQLRAHLTVRDETSTPCTIGVWGSTQHPNYLGELGFWWGLWLTAVAVAPDWWWTIIGAVAMTGLFWFISIPMMLARKRKRHPNYDQHVRGIPVLLPRMHAGD